MVATLGASTGNQTSYQSSRAKSFFGTPRGGRRTVPSRVPSSASARLPQPHDANRHRRFSMKTSVTAGDSTCSRRRR